MDCIYDDEIECDEDCENFECEYNFMFLNEDVRF